LDLPQSIVVGADNLFQHSDCPSGCGHVHAWVSRVATVDGRTKFSGSLELAAIRTRPVEHSSRARRIHLGKYRGSVSWNILLALPASVESDDGEALRGAAL